MCTDKQAAYTSKPFFYSIKFQEGISVNTETGEVSDPMNRVVFDIDTLNSRRATVTNRIPSASAYGSFSNAIADVLINQGQGKKAEAAITNEELVLQQALDSQQPYFASLLEEQQRKVDRQAALEKSAAQRVLDMADTVIIDPPSTSDVDEVEEVEASPGKRIFLRPRPRKDTDTFSLSLAVAEAASAALQESNPHIKLAQAQTAVKDAYKKAQGGGGRK